MYKSEPNNIDISVKTDYNKRRKYLLNNKNNHNYNSFYRNDDNINNNHTNNRYKNKIKNDCIWSDMQLRTSKEGQDKLISNSKTYHSNMLPVNNYNNLGEKKHFKESDNYDYSVTTQITTLPGGIKRNKYEIKDDYIFPKPYNYSRLYKQVYDYNSNIKYDYHYDPITQGYNVNSFPTKQRYYGSYKRGVQDHDIFNKNFYNNHKYLYDF
jgi:hypothetical protein